MDGQKKVNGIVFLALGLLFICSAVVGVHDGEIYALRPSPRIAVADQPEAFQRRVWTQLSLGLMCVAGASGYLWANRPRP